MEGSSLMNDMPSKNPQQATPSSSLRRKLESSPKNFFNRIILPNESSIIPSGSFIQNSQASQMISVIFTWFLLSSYLLKLLVFLYFFWFDLIFIYIYLFICALKEWEDFKLIYKGFTCKVGLGQLNQVNLHPARHEFKRRPTQLNLSPTRARNQRNLHQIQVQFGLGFQPAHQLIFLAELSAQMSNRGDSSWAGNLT